MTSVKQRIVERLKQGGEFSNFDLSGLLQVSQNTVRRCTKELARAGSIEVCPRQYGDIENFYRAAV